jgi:hypothetical protein
MIMHWRVPALMTAVLIVSAAAPADATVQRTARTERATSTGSTVPCRTGADDFDGNGGTDLAIGAEQTGGDEDSDIAPTGQVVVEMRVKSGYRTVRINPPTLPAHRLGDFGHAVAELDLSDHTQPTRPCSALAISANLYDTDASLDEDVFISGVVLLYRYDKSARHFVELSMIRGTEIDPALTGFGDALASQQMPAARPRPRQPVLYVGALSGHAPYDRGAVVRLVLSATGRVRTSQVIAPGTTATARMPLTYSAAGTGYDRFGSTLQATPSADQVIIGDPGARRGGAVIVWNRTHASQLLTERDLGKHATSSDDGFGLALWLSTEAANASGRHTSLFIGAPGRTVKGRTFAGAAFQLRYNRSTSPARAVLSSARYWTQATAGVAGTPRRGDEFGSSFQSLSNGKSPKFLVGVPGQANGRSYNQYGAIDVLGNGRAFTDTVLHHNKIQDSQIGYTMAAWRNVDDYLANDPWPAPGKGKWSRLVVVGDPIGNEVYSGLPAGTFHDPQTIHDGRYCSYETGSCGFGAAMTSSGGG